MNPLLSIITPVYNVESYLDRSIQSILSQSYRDIELILIDDGSTDGSSSLCDEFAKKDDRVSVVHKENGGVSTARNVGLEIATGEYLTFVDPDDFLAPDTYMVNMEYLTAHKDVDILQYPYCNYISDDEILNYHRPAEHISEDTCLVPVFVNKARSIFISEKGLYYYQRDRVDSYTFGEYSFDKHLDLFYAHTTIYDCFKMFPEMVTEKVLAFTRLYRRLITARQTDCTADVEMPLSIIKEGFPTWLEIIRSKNTEKIWLSSAKILGARLFIRLFLKYLKA